MKKINELYEVREACRKDGITDEFVSQFLSFRLDDRCLLSPSDI
jgi:hypothetical protein